MTVQQAAAVVAGLAASLLALRWVLAHLTAEGHAQREQTRHLERMRQDVLQMDAAAALRKELKAAEDRIARLETGNLRR